MKIFASSLIIGAITATALYMSSINAENSMPGLQVMAQTAAVYTGQFTKPTTQELKQTLSPLQFRVTQHEGTERPFKNEFWDNKKKGIYVDIVSGEPLFSSTDKFKSGTGWPSFTQPIVKNSIIETSDRAFFMTRTELKSTQAKSHLGHVFDDGPNPTGLRYCINSASLKFIAKDNMASLGYEDFIQYVK